MYFTYSFVEDTNIVGLLSITTVASTIFGCAHSLVQIRCAALPTSRTVQSG